MVFRIYPDFFFTMDRVEEIIDVINGQFSILRKGPKLYLCIYNDSPGVYNINDHKLIFRIINLIS